MMPPVVHEDTQVEEAVRKVEAEMKPDVVRIRHSIRQDWADDWAIYFRVLLSDDAAEHRLGPITREVERRLDQLLDFAKLGVFAYHRYRSESEQAKYKDKEWAA
jgi:hypothetical protein